MSTQKLNNTEIKNAFQVLFEQSAEEKVEHRAHMLSYIFLSEAEKAMERKGWSKKQLAEQLGTSASYLTQLFRGDRLLNLKTIAKIEQALSLEYQITQQTNAAKNKQYTRFFVESDNKNMNINSVLPHDCDQNAYKSYAVCTIHEIKAA